MDRLESMSNYCTLSTSSENEDCGEKAKITYRRNRRRNHVYNNKPPWWKNQKGTATGFPAHDDGEDSDDESDSSCDIPRNYRTPVLNNDWYLEKIVAPQFSHALNLSANLVAEGEINQESDLENSSGNTCHFDANEEEYSEDDEEDYHYSDEGEVDDEEYEDATDNDENEYFTHDNEVEEQELEDDDENDLYDDQDQPDQYYDTQGGTYNYQQQEQYAGYYDNNSENFEDHFDQNSEYYSTSADEDEQPDFDPLGGYDSSYDDDDGDMTNVGLGNLYNQCIDTVWNIFGDLYYDDEGQDDYY